MVVVCSGCSGGRAGVIHLAPSATTSPTGPASLSPKRRLDHSGTTNKYMRKTHTQHASVSKYDMQILRNINHKLSINPQLNPWSPWACKDSRVSCPARSVPARRPPAPGAPLTGQQRAARGAHAQNSWHGRDSLSHSRHTSGTVQRHSGHSVNIREFQTLQRLRDCVR